MCLSCTKPTRGRGAHLCTGGDACIREKKSRSMVHSSWAQFHWQKTQCSSGGFMVCRKKVRCIWLMRFFEAFLYIRHLGILCCLCFWIFLLAVKEKMNATGVQLSDGQLSVICLFMVTYIWSRLEALSHSRLPAVWGFNCCACTSLCIIRALTICTCEISQVLAVVLLSSWCCQECAKTHQTVCDYRIQMDMYIIYNTFVLSKYKKKLHFLERMGSAVHKLNTDLFFHITRAHRLRTWTQCRLVFYDQHLKK